MKVGDRQFYVIDKKDTVPNFKNLAFGEVYNREFEGLIPSQRAFILVLKSLRDGNRVQNVDRNNI